MIATGHSHSAAASSSESPVPIKEATPMARLMLSVSPLPQY